MNSSNRTEQYTSNKSGQTIMMVEEIIFKWEILNFSFINTSNGKFASSPEFSSQIEPKLKWRLEIYPNGESAKSDGHCSLFLRSMNDNMQVMVSSKMSIVNSKNEDLLSRIFKNRLFGGNLGDQENTWGYSQFIKRDLLLNNEKEYLPDDKLTIICKIEAGIKLKYSSPLETFKQATNVDDHLKLEVNLVTMFENNAFSDVTLIAEDQAFCAHKVILAAASPIFREMLECEKPHKSLMNLQDIRPVLLKEMLRFIYTNEVLNLTNIADQLIILANKFALSKLKILCERSLISSLTPDNLLDALITANEYHCENLQKAIYELFAIHREEIFNSKKFKEMLDSHSTLMAKLCSSLCTTN